jgi:hypothetical protein
MCKPNPAASAGLVSANRAPQGSLIIFCDTGSLVRRSARVVGKISQRCLLKSNCHTYPAQRVEQRLTCPVVGRRRDLYEVGVTHDVLHRQGT